MLQEAIASDSKEPVQPVCLNCGTTLVGRHCHACGQKARLHHSLGAFFHDLLHGVLHLEGKMWRTLPLLAWRPGELTRRYIEGERARFVSPLAAFLFSVFLMFAAFAIAGGPIKTSPYEVRIGSDYFYYTPSLPRAEEELRRDRDELTAHRARLIEQEARPHRIAQADHTLTVLAAAIAMIEDGERQAPPSPPAAANRGQQAGAVSPGNYFWWIFTKVGENPPLIANEVQNKAYKFSWALIPISVPFLWLLMLGNRRNRFYEHTIFVTYSLSFVTLLLVLMTVSRPLGLLDTIALPFPFIVAWHMYRHLRGAYLLSWAGALWRTALLLIFALMATLLFAILLIAAA